MCSILSCGGWGSCKFVSQLPGFGGSVFLQRWKFDNKYNQLRHPFMHLPDCNGILYSLQLSVYAYFLEDGYGMPVADDMYLAVCHPENPEPALVRVPRMKAEIEALVEYELSAA